MGHKRDYEEMGTPDPEQGSPAPLASQAMKKRKFTTKTKHKPNEGSIEWAKKRARTIERLLKRNQDLPANVQNDLERELAAHKVTVEDKTFHKKRSAMISKYHMVRFFERKKAMRLAKQLRRKLQTSTSDEEKEKLNRDVHIAEVDEAYTQYFPHAEPYISLYTNPKPEEASNDEDEATQLAKALLKMERPPMWHTVEKAMQEGPEALRNLRERRSPDGGSQSQKKKKAASQSQKAKTSAPVDKPVVQKAPQAQQQQRNTNLPRKKDPAQPKNRRERRLQMRQTQALQTAAAEKSDEDSDGGGFFEED